MRRTPLLGTVEWKALMESIDPDIKKPDIEYEFSNGRKSREQIPGGNLYAPPVTPDPE